jgi:hypothetical protein
MKIVSSNVQHYFNLIYQTAIFSSHESAMPGAVKVKTARTTRKTTASPESATILQKRQQPRLVDF